MPLGLKIFFIFVSLLCGCAGVGIPPAEYSTLATPQETYEFAKKAVAKDDPEAFYHCLAEGTRERFSLSDLKLGWALAGGFFYLFLDSRLKDLESPAPEPMFHGNLDTAKLTLAVSELEAYFLLHREEGKWRLVFPAPYPMPDIAKIKSRKRAPWRTQEYAYYQVPSGRYGQREKISRKNDLPPSVRPPWRTQEHSYYQAYSERQWYHKN